MFGTKTKTKATTSASSSSNRSVGPHANAGSTCIIAKGTVIEGKFKSVEDLRVDGTIIGDVSCQKRFVMGPTGKIVGTVDCAESNIEGKIEGEIRVSGRLHLHETGIIQGKIVAKKLVVDEGATYNGECLIGEQHFKK
ncbi:MAG: polymer-forming cytoskeletal protein [Bacteroidota bacterium]